MKTLFDAAVSDEIKLRIEQLREDAVPQWGRMNAAQVVAHCASGLEMAMGQIRPPRALLGRLIGSWIKPKVVGDDGAFRRNSPTVRELVVDDVRDLTAERTRLRGLIDKFVSGAASVCTTHPHPFFGSLTPAEWSVLMYKHLDHHLRQFGV